MEKTHFKNIMLKHKDLLYSQAYYFTNNKADAEDITQEVLITFWHHIENVEKGYVKAWLLRVTRNKCIDYCRRRKNQITVDEQSEENLLEMLADIETNPEEHIINKIYADNIINLMNELPEKLRTIMILRDIQDLKYEIIAETLDLPLNTVKVYLHRGRKLLLKKITHLSNQDFQRSN